MDDPWLQQLDQFFRSELQGLEEILDAAACREAWLQGELFRYFRVRRALSTFTVNTLPISSNQKADFALDSPHRAFGEIKLIGADYATKCLTGGAITQCMARLDVPVGAPDRGLVLGPWGLIPDFFRLLDFAATSDRDAYLILIVDLRSPSKAALSTALRRVNFLAPSHDIPASFGLTRIWKIHDRTALLPPDRSVAHPVK